MRAKFHDHVSNGSPTRPLTRRSNRGKLIRNLGKLIRAPMLKTRGRQARPFATFESIAGNVADGSNKVV
jgi:hypothetical protein